MPVEKDKSTAEETKISERRLNTKRRSFVQEKRRSTPPIVFVDEQKEVEQFCQGDCLLLIQCLANRREPFIDQRRSMSNENISDLLLLRTRWNNKTIELCWDDDDDDRCWRRRKKSERSITKVGTSNKAASSDWIRVNYCSCWLLMLSPASSFDRNRRIRPNIRRLPFDFDRSTFHWWFRRPSKGANSRCLVHSTTNVDRANSDCRSRSTLSAVCSLVLATDRDAISLEHFETKPKRTFDDDDQDEGAEGRATFYLKNSFAQLSLLRENFQTFRVRIVVLGEKCFHYA